ncbi:unnamed protein product [Agarophyton chilense]
MAILLPSGVRGNDILTQVIGNVNVFDMVVDWLSSMNDARILHKLWLSKYFDPMKKYHLRTTGFEKSSRSIRRCSSDTMKSFNNMRLPFKDKTHIPQQTVIDFEDGSSVLYVDWKAPDDNYARRNSISHVQVG